MQPSAHVNVVSIAHILGLGDKMPKARYQTPSVFQNKCGSFFIRPWVDVLGEDGIERRKKTIVLGPAEIGKREAIARRNRIMQQLNRADYVIQSQIKLKDFLAHYKIAHFENLSASTRAKYRCHLKKHIEPAFADLMLCEITT